MNIDQFSQKPSQHVLCFLQGGKNSEIRDSRGVSSKNRQRSKAFHTLMTQKNRTPVLMLKTHDRNENTSLTK